jgi:hypothetical protein
MSCSDYIATKKKMNSPYFPSRSSSDRTKNIEYCTVQTTPLIDEDGDYIETNNRYSIPLSNEYDMAMPSFNMNYRKPMPMFNITRRSTPYYVKNRFVNPFCWTCPQTEEEILNELKCNVCEHVSIFSQEMSNVLEDVDSDESFIYRLMQQEKKKDDYYNYEYNYEDS